MMARECIKEDGMLRHLADSHEWRNINREWPDFGGKVKKLRLELCTDKMNIYENMSSCHST
jgi:Transposase family tnp2